MLAGVKVQVPPNTTSVLRRILLTLHAALAKCIVGPPVHSAPWPASKSWEMFNFSCSAGSVGQSDAAMQTHFTRLLDPFCNNKHEEAGNIWPLNFFKEMWNDRIVYSHLLFVSSFVFICTHWLCLVFLKPAIIHIHSHSCVHSKSKATFLFALFAWD